MSTYAIGDVQGCYRSFSALIDKLQFDESRDCLWLVGDIINRGPDSLAMLRWAHAHQSSCKIVLGNHDLALIAIYHALRKKKALDTLDAVFEAPDLDLLVGWLKKQPLVFAGPSHIMLHAGVLPSWDEAYVFEGAARIQALLQDPVGSVGLLSQALDKKRPHTPDENGFDLPEMLRVLTNLRALDPKGQPDFSFKGPPQAMTAEQTPWFLHLDARRWPRPLVTGHWSALGLMQTKQLNALDTGCVWGGSLTALCLEDGRIIQQPSCEVAPLTPDSDG